ncbi:MULTISPECIES: hypothetical protein [Acinetobacter]|jgi:hypothetical protein|uniref:Uncharacterized protein n=2 Tax=Acinetobacter bereziniae TaxID=106648 RepID=A0A0A8TNH7_ACIBZ|nr:MULTISPECIES: hypothetical protein [Acinetobacter]MEC8124848.1 hypothetical protein [Pseudomonadota bacterium]ATZ62724.1 hypothetical protein BSR55_04850 [Acinetobacter bereziniae]ENV97222.1 hypothetical protein F938_01549 [Acinetobacter bereziniae LMG 1003 = CIP 70.12]MBI0393211.1 hypothetical protein [Acinetobacter bereziniae]MBJ9905828.1 hypothetical protein [Acinetobacter bereziniae]
MSLKLDVLLKQNSENLSPKQKKFNRLIKKVEQLKVLLSEWEHAQNDIQKRASGEILPKYAELHQIMFQQLEILWKHKLETKWAKTQALRLDDLIESVASQLMIVDTLSEKQFELVEKILSSYEISEDEFFKADIKEHQLEEMNIVDQEELTAERLDEINKRAFIEMMASKLGVESDYFDFEFNLYDHDDFIEKLHEKMEKDREQEFLKQLNKTDRDDYERKLKNEKDKQKKLAEKRALAKQKANQSFKNIYLKIASLIHPDREQNEERKIEKTEILQRVNQAYENKDLFALLKYQIEFTASVEKFNNLAKEQLEFYNINLEEQAEELQSKIDDIIYSFDWNDHIDMHSLGRIKVKDLYKKFDKDVLIIKKNLERAERALEIFSDRAELKSLLRKRYY